MRTVAIVGRPNVGKSALFNRLAGRRISIVHDQPGVTRDRLGAVCKLGSAPFEIVDTGGIGWAADEEFHEATRTAAEAAIASADVILFVVDGLAGLAPLDRELAEKLRQSGRAVLLVVNKMDTAKHEAQAVEFAALGFDEMRIVSAAHGRGISELVAAAEAKLPPGEALPEGHEPPRLAVVGRPNVGKSSLVNALLGDSRTIVSEVAGTTRDAVEVLWKWNGVDYLLCDTAGLRHRRKHSTSVEVFSVMRTEEVIKRADVCVLVIDATEGVTAFDKKIAGLIQEAQKAAIIVLNKWDLLPGEGREEHIAAVRRQLFFLDYAPVVVLSAKLGTQVKRLHSTVQRVREQARQRCGTGELNRLLKRAMEQQAPPSKGSRSFKLLYATQAGSEQPRPFAPPTIVCFVNAAALMTDPYQTYLIRQIRAKIPYEGLPIRLRYRNREAKDRE
ncbi:MAG TPA: ribosome biogenesis GTPase Der [Chthoniobacterales bacterium]